MTALNFNLSIDDLVALQQEIQDHSNKVYDSIVTLSDEESTFESVLVPLGKLENWTSERENVVTFMQYVSADPAMRDASTEADKKLRAFFIDSGMRRDIYARVKAVLAKPDELSKITNAEDARLLEKIALDFRRNGLALEQDDYDKLKALKKTMSELSVDFARRIAEDKASLSLTREELDGMPEDWLSGLKQDDAGKLVVTMKYPDLHPLLRFCKVEETRRRMLQANDERFPENIKVLEDTVALRKEAATLLGYASHAHYKLETKMAKTPEAVTAFLDDLRTRLKPLGERDVNKMLALKRQDTGREDVAIMAWDYQYYMNKIKELEFELDEEAIKEYFSLASVTDGMLAIYESTLGLTFAEIHDPPVWHPDVRMFQVQHAEDGSFVGHFYLDMHPREGKYNHAACFGLRMSFANDDGSHQYPAAAMVANFTKPTQDKPSLLNHDEVVTYFHELGHVMHQICSVTKWSRFHGTSVERDFVEAPSQMLENWCWHPETLRKLSAHYLRPDEPLPADTIDRMVKAKNNCSGMFYLRQLFFGIFDMTVHTSAEPVDTSALWESLRGEVCLIPSIPATWPAAAFGHIMGGYDVGYYGYLWSQVFSADMFYSRFKSDIQDKSVGLLYRYEILKPGGSRDGMDSLKAFLGREPKSDAFLHAIGLEADSVVTVAE